MNIKSIDEYPCIDCLLMCICSKIYREACSKITQYTRSQWIGHILKCKEKNICPCCGTYKDFDEECPTCTYCTGYRSHNW